MFKVKVMKFIKQKDIEYFIYDDDKVKFLQLIFKLENFKLKNI